MRREGRAQEHLFRLAGTTLVGLVLLGIALRRFSLSEDSLPALTAPQWLQSTRRTQGAEQTQ